MNDQRIPAGKDQERRIQGTGGAQRSKDFRWEMSFAGSRLREIKRPMQLADIQQQGRWHEVGSPDQVREHLAGHVEVRMLLLHWRVSTREA